MHREGKVLPHDDVYGSKYRTTQSTVGQIVPVESNLPLNHPPGTNLQVKDEIPGHRPVIKKEFSSHQ